MRFCCYKAWRPLSLCVERHCNNAMVLARWLQEHPKVEWVWYPGLEDSPYHENAKKYFRKGLFGSMLSFDVRGAIEQERLR